MGKTAARSGGVYASHIRGEGKEVVQSVNEAITIGEQAGMPVEIFHPKVAYKRGWGILMDSVRVIAHYVKERKVLTLPEAIRKMTSWPATRMRLANRGIIKEGDWADVTIFDLAALQDRATYEHPTESPAGIDWVLVNGVVTIDHGKHTGAKAGQVMYGPGRGVPAQVIPN